MRSDPERCAGENRLDAGDLRRRALRGVLIMALASSPLIWVKLRLVTGIPRMAYAAEVTPSAAMNQASAVEAAVEGLAEAPVEAVVARVD